MQHVPFLPDEDLIGRDKGLRKRVQKAYVASHFNHHYCFLQWQYHVFWSPWIKTSWCTNMLHNQERLRTSTRHVDYPGDTKYPGHPISKTHSRRGCCWPAWLTQKENYQAKKCNSLRPEQFMRQLMRYLSDSEIVHEETMLIQIFRLFTQQLMR